MMLAFKSVAVFLVEMSAGIIASLLAPALLDLKLLFSASYEAISVSLALRGFGIIPGSLLAGHILEKHFVYADVSMSLAHFVCIAGMFIAPFVVYIQVFCVVWTVIGIALGIVYVVGLHVFVTLWKKQTTICTQVYIFAVTLGALLSPVLANPFLVDACPVSTDKDPESHQSTFRNTTTTNVPWKNDSCNDALFLDAKKNSTLQPSDTNVQYAFVTVGALAFAMWIPWTVWSVSEFYQLRRSDASGVSQLETSGGRSETEFLKGAPKFWFQFCSVLFAFVNSISYFVICSFIRAVSVDIFFVDRDTASLINTTFFIGIAVSPIVCIAISVCISTRLNFLLFSAAHFVIVALWAFLAAHNFTLHWAGSIGIALTIPASSTLVVSFYKEHISSISSFLSMATCCRGLADLIFVWLTGRLYDIHGPGIVYIISVPVAGAMFALALVLVVISLVFHPRDQGYVRLN